MKRFFFCIALACSTLLFAAEPFQYNTSEPWKNLINLPDANGFLPQAASTWDGTNKQEVVTIPTLQDYDEYIYEQSKFLRETDRGIQAVFEEQYQAIPSRFAEVMGADIADQSTFPILNALINACINLKSYHTDYYMVGETPTEGLRDVAILRQRPRSTHADETKENGTRFSDSGASSYPSGHGYAEWLVASCLAYINPKVSTQIFAIAQDYGYSRVIIAAHWMTDINAGERLGAAAFAALLANDDFRAMLDATKTEYTNYVVNYTYSIPNVTINDNFDWSTKYNSYKTTTSHTTDGTMTILRRYNGQHINVTLGRTFKGGMWNTVCLPFSLETLEGTPFAGAQVIAFTNANVQDAQAGGQELVLDFEPVQAMQAGVSYLVNVGANDLTNPVFNNVLLVMNDPKINQNNIHFTRDVTYNGITFHGVINKKTISGNTLFLGDNNTLFYPSSSGTIKGFRAYFALPTTAAKLPARICLQEQGGVTTDIISVTPEGGSQSGALVPKKLLQEGEIVITDGTQEYSINGTIR